ncbi:MAG: NAD kinase [Salinivirgaceae bacterium]|nr:NAD kinase [Salinivirgaceae bacterium]
MDVAIYSRTFEPQHEPVLRSLFKALSKYNASVWLHPTLASWKDAKKFTSIKLLEQATATLDFIIVVGGDGSFLQAVCEFDRLKVPFIGINMGRLGFLADVSPENIGMAIDNLVNGEYMVERRTLLNLLPHIDEIAYPHALNEITVHKRERSQMITIHTQIDGRFLTSYWADGLIIATPTGSTAYSMSAGGPIVSPSSKNFIITPIASHALTVRPLIIPDSSEIKIVVEARDSDYMLTVDSHSVVLDRPMELTIKKSDRSIQVVKFHEQNFFDTLRNKLMWGADKRN